MMCVKRFVEVIGVVLIGWLLAVGVYALSTSLLSLALDEGPFDPPVRTILRWTPIPTLLATFVLYIPLLLFLRRVLPRHVLRAALPLAGAVVGLVPALLFVFVLGGNTVDLFSFVGLVFFMFYGTFGAVLGIALRHLPGTWGI